MCEHCATWRRLDARRRKKPTPEQRRKFRLKTRYGISVEEYDKLLLLQEDRCPVCKKRSPTHVDHDHDTGAVRGILHPFCNQLLGLAQENVETLKGAIEYLESYQAKRNY